MVKNDDFQKFSVAFYSTDKYKGLRFGQAFCNHFNIKDTEVFYCENDQAVMLIFARWLDFSHEPVRE